MTGVDKFALAKALHDARMVNYGPQVLQQFDCCVTAIMDVVCVDAYEVHQFRALVERDNWLAQDNPFQDLS